MNKSELIKKFSEEHKIPLEESTIIVSTFFDSIAEYLIQDKRVEIRGFGSFKLKKYDSYKGRNPKTGEYVQVKPKKMPYFRAGKKLKEILNED